MPCTRLRLYNEASCSMLSPIALVCLRPQSTRVSKQETATHACMQGGAEHVAQHDSVARPSALRDLQAAAGTAGEGEVAYVATAEELQAAAGAGARHIVITDHLDLSSLAAFKGVKLKRMIETMASTWSIRVRCLQIIASAHEDCCMCHAVRGCACACVLPILRSPVRLECTLP
jgi:hypothetical protein